MIGRRVDSLIARIVPKTWRATVAQDIQDEARRAGRSTIWRWWHLFRAGLRLRSWFGMDAWLTDVRDAWRSVRRHRGFAAAAMLTFALAVGVTVAVLSVIDQTLFRSLPYGEADRLVQIHSVQINASPARLALDGSIAEALWQRATTLEGLTSVGGGASPEQIPGFGESPVRRSGIPQELLPLLRVRPVVGRGFAPEDSGRKPYVLLISWDTWQGRFGGATEAIGKPIGSGPDVYEIVGVLPRGFFPPASGSTGRVDAFYLSQSPALGDGRGGGIASPVIARLKPGVTLDQARAEAAVIAGDLARASAAAGTRVIPSESVQVNPLQTSLFLLYRPYLWLSAAAVALVLLLASVNLTVLLLARLQSRLHETAIRASLGASRARLARVVVIECVLVCVASSVAAVLACRLAQGAIQALVPSVLQASTVPMFDLRLLAITAGLSVLGALVAGLFPALRFSRANVATLLARTGGRTLSGLPGRRILLAAEAALGVLLVTGAVVTVRSFAGMVLKHPGFVAEDLYEMSTSAGWQNRWPIKEAWRDDRAPMMLQIARTLPGVRQAGVGTGLPTEGNAGTQAFWKARGVSWGGEFGVTGGYFEALGTEIRAGRVIVDDDVTSMTNAAVLSEAGARVLWPGEPPSRVLGRSFDYLDGSSKTVVGVVADFNRVPGESAHPLLFLPFGTHGLGASTSNLYVPLRMQPGMRPDTAEINRRMREAGWRGGAGVDYVPDNLEPWLREPRFQAALFAVLAVIALVVAGVGLFAVASFESARRQFEVGIRFALGATARDARRLVLRTAVAPVLIGTVIGLIASWWAAEFVQTFLFEVDARGTGTLLTVAAVLVATAHAAAWLPARRAARTDPAAVLRTT